MTGAYFYNTYFNYRYFTFLGVKDISQSGGRKMHSAGVTQNSKNSEQYNSVQTNSG